jgi:hypothetical protein
MVFKPEAIAKIKQQLIEQFQKSAAALEGINAEGVQAFETTDGNVIVGEIVGMKYENHQLLIRVIAAKDVDHKLRNLESKAVKKRTYPLPLYCIVSSKTLEHSQVPLYVNYAYKSTQFKNKYFNAKPKEI